MVCTKECIWVPGMEFLSPLNFPNDRYVFVIHGGPWTTTEF